MARPRSRWIWIAEVVRYLSARMMSQLQRVRYQVEQVAEVPVWEKRCNMPLPWLIYSIPASKIAAYGKKSNVISFTFIPWVHEAFSVHCKPF